LGYKWSNRLIKDKKKVMKKIVLYRDTDKLVLEIFDKENVKVIGKQLKIINPNWNENSPDEESPYKMVNTFKINKYVEIDSENLPNDIENVKYKYVDGEFFKY
jgi:hypothetical protein